MKLTKRNMEVLIALHYGTDQSDITIGGGDARSRMYERLRMAGFIKWNGATLDFELTVAGENVVAEDVARILREAEKNAA